MLEHYGKGMIEAIQGFFENFVVVVESSFHLWDQSAGLVHRPLNIINPASASCLYHHWPLVPVRTIHENFLPGKVNVIVYLMCMSRIIMLMVLNSIILIGTSTAISSAPQESFITIQIWRQFPRQRSYKYIQF